MRSHARVLPLFVALFGLLESSLAVKPADAQSLDPSAIPGAEPVIIAPKKLSDPGVQYPRGALAAHIFAVVHVTLVLDVAIDGTVTRAVVASDGDTRSPIVPGYGFEETAIAAAKQVLFEPATRDGKPIASRVKLAYDFAPPAPRLTGTVTKQATDSAIGGATVRATFADGTTVTTTTDSTGAWSIAKPVAGKVHVDVVADGFVAEQADDTLTPAEETRLVLRLARVPEPTPASTDAGGPTEEVEEVTVKGVRPPREVTKRTIEQDEIQHIPGSNGDVLGAVLSLPGVGRPAPFSGQLLIRGSAPADTQILVNGTNIPLAYHFGGFDSVIPADLVKKLDFYPGNFSTAYGRGMGGVIDLTLRDPKSDRLHAVAQVDLIDVRVLAEGPIFNTGWNFLVAGRRSWFDVWLGPVLDKLNAGVTVAPRYYDWQAELQRNLSKHSSFRVTFLGSNDAFAILNLAPSQSQPTFGGSLNFGETFWRVQAQYENRISPNTEVRATAAVGRDEITFGLGANYFDLGTTPISLRAEVSQKIVPDLTANLGLDLIDAPYNVKVSFPPFPKPGQPSAGPGQPPIQTNTSGYTFTPGAYAELEYTPWPTTRIVPGIREDYDKSTGSWDTSPRLTIRQVVKDSFPRTTLKGGAGIFYQPPLPQETDPTFGMTGLHSNRSVHYDVGFDQDISRQVVLTNDVWYKSFENQVELSSNPAMPGGNVGSGFAYGAEWLLKYSSDSHFFGWIAYTISRSERRAFPGQQMSLFEYDQTHVLTALGSYVLPRRWRVGARANVTSGDLYTPTTEGAFDGTAGSQAGVTAVPAFGRRFGTFGQVDVRVDKSWQFKSWSLTSYLDIKNVTNQSNPAGISYNYNYTQSSKVNGLPILPSLGFRGEF